MLRTNLGNCVIVDTSEEVGSHRRETICSNKSADIEVLSLKSAELRVLEGVRMLEDEERIAMIFGAFFGMWW